MFSAINGPARRTFMPRLLRTELIPAGAALSMMTMHLAIVIGPLAAGLITPVGGLKACYSSTRSRSSRDVRDVPAAADGPEGTTQRPGLRAVVEGLAFLGRNRVLGGVLVADVSATLLAMPVAIFPAINAERFGGSPRTLGLLSAGLAVGGVIGTVFSGPLRHVHRQGLASWSPGRCGAPAWSASAWPATSR